MDLGLPGSPGQGGGGGSSAGSSSYSGDGSQWNYTFDRVPTEVWVLIASIACLAILIGIALWVVSIIARGGLIAGVQQVEDEGSHQLWPGLARGRSRFWTLFGIGILAALPMIILVVLGIVVLGLLIVGTVGAFDRIVRAAGAMGIRDLDPLRRRLLLRGIILAIVLNQIRIYAERAAILEDLGWIDAFKRGWEVLKANLGPDHHLLAHLPRHRPA